MAVTPAGAQQFVSTAYEIIYNMFSLDPNEGLTTFLSTMIPMGGSAESMGMAFTAVADDLSFLELNPAGSAVLERTEFALYHNNWIADTRIEGAVYSMRFRGFGLSVGGKWLNVPITEYDPFGARSSGGYYSEVLAIGNLAAHFFPGYYFYGIALGANVKLAYRSFPDYADEDGVVVEGSGGTQSSVGIMVDAGILTRFNFLKLYSSRSRNVSVGFALKNIGPPSRGEPMPTVATLGLSYNIFKPIRVSADISVPINLQDFSASERIYWGIGYSMAITEFWDLRAGLLVKGGNPRLSIGANLGFSPVSLAVNYTLDLTTESTPFHRMSIEARFDMGDMGRATRARTVDDLYLRGLDAYASGNLELAIQLWTEALALDPFFDPAREGLKTATAALDLQRQMLELQVLE